MIKGSAQALVERDNTAVKETLVTLEKQSWEAWEKTGWKILPTISRRRSREGRRRWGTATKAQVVALVASPVCVVKSYSIDRLALTMFDANTALLIYHVAQDTTCKGVAVPSPVWATSLYKAR